MQFFFLLFIITVTIANEPCPSVGVGTWSPWSAANQPCSKCSDQDGQMRTRFCIPPIPSQTGCIIERFHCVGSRRSVTPCQPASTMQPQPGNMNTTGGTCNWGAWSSSNCSTPCGHFGSRVLTRNCPSGCQCQGPSSMQDDTSCDVPVSTYCFYPLAACKRGVSSLRVCKPPMCNKPQLACIKDTMLSSQPVTQSSTPLMTSMAMTSMAMTNEAMTTEEITNEAMTNKAMMA